MGARFLFKYKMSTKRRRSSDSPALLYSAPKRSRIDVPTQAAANHEAARESKRPEADRERGVDRFSLLSDELLIRVLHYVDIQSLIKCQRVSNRINRLSGDTQVWKRLYYEAFVRKRALRVPGAREKEEVVGSSRRANWVGEERGSRRRWKGDVVEEDMVDWKKQYKLRHNWSRGACAVEEITVGERSSDKRASLLVRLVEGVVVTVDAEGLRAWDLKNKSLLAEMSLRDIPLSLAVDEGKAARGGDIEVAVGFDDGAFGIYRLGSEDGKFQMLYEHSASSNGRLSALAYAHPYLLSMTDTQLLSLYTFDPKTEEMIFALGVKVDMIGVELETKEEVEAAEPKVESLKNQQQAGLLDPPRLLSSLKSHSAWPPLSLSLRSTSKGAIIASIVYALPTFLAGWSVGLQELHIDTPSGTISHSRLASAIESGFQPLSLSPSPSYSPTPYSRTSGQRTLQGGQQTRPTSLSYSHPYLLASHPDNTLMLYLVKSTTEALSIRKDTQLLGHTSAVSGAHVGGRGKAVSVSRRGNELRVWELEGGLGSSSSKSKQGQGGATGNLTAATTKSVIVRPGQHDVEAEGSLCSGAGWVGDDIDIDVHVDAIRGWVGFDEESVIVLKESGVGDRRARALMVYDFT